MTTQSAADPSWASLREAAGEAAARLKARGETVAVAESSAGGLIAAALLAVPGASAYFRGGAVVYTGDAKQRLLDKTREAITNPRAATEAHALVLARAIRDRLDATWGIGETGATGPTGNRYGDPPGHACLAIAGPNAGPNAGPDTGPDAGPSRTGPAAARAITVSTGSSDRETNMHTFATAALRLLTESLA